MLHLVTIVTTNRTIVDSIEPKRVHRFCLRLVFEQLLKLFSKQDLTDVDSRYTLTIIIVGAFSPIFNAQATTVCAVSYSNYFLAIRACTNQGAQDPSKFFGETQVKGSILHTTDFKCKSKISQDTAMKCAEFKQF